MLDEGGLGGAQGALPRRLRRGSPQQKANQYLRGEIPRGGSKPGPLGWRNGATCQREERAEPGEN